MRIPTLPESGRQPVSTDSPIENPLLYARSVSRALNIVGDRTALLLAYWVFLGVYRFAELQVKTGLSKSLVSNRLKRLEQQGVLERRAYQGGRYEYHLTPMGKDLYEVALALIRWDKQWHYSPDCVTHHLIHKQCGQGFLPVPVCTRCNQEFEARSCDWHYGPGKPDTELRRESGSRRSRISPAALAVEHPIMDRSLEILGDRWTALTIAAAFYRVRTFGGFQQALGIATNILSDRLGRLVAVGIFSEREHSRSEYRLTEQGLALFPVVASLMRWGDKWLADEGGPAQVLVHRSCNSLLEPLMRCDQCSEALHFGDFHL